MIYLDNAATGGFKPHSVTDTVDTVVRYLSANPGRSGHRLSLTGAEILSDTRSLFAQTFGCESDRTVFTKNCTEALNYAVFGTLVEGGHVITTAYEHNSVLRPLHTLKSHGLIELDVVYPNEKQRLVDQIAQKINDKTYMVITTACSNVTGEVLPVSEIGELCKERNLIYIVDGAQAGGHVKLNLKTQNISALCLAGHKGLYGIMGSGVLLFSDEIDIQPMLFGGTGTESFNLISPEAYPDKLEVGTVNLPAIASIKEGLNYVNKNFDNFSSYLLLATQKLIKKISEIEEIKCYSAPNPSGIVSFSVQGYESSEVADILNKKYDIAVRSGFHCAPLMHKLLKTEDSGLVRVSIAPFNSERELSYLVSCLRKITKTKSF